MATFLFNTNIISDNELHKEVPVLQTELSYIPSILLQRTNPSLCKLCYFIKIIYAFVIEFSFWYITRLEGGQTNVFTIQIFDEKHTIFAVVFEFESSFMCRKGFVFSQPLLKKNGRLFRKNRHPLLLRPRRRFYYGNFVCTNGKALLSSLQILKTIFK